MSAPSSHSPRVSVVVPIYKVEGYLRPCVDSILSQTLEDIEVILVDDGSPDSCPQLVDEYAAQDARVVAIHQPNGGYGRAVNHGISRARGEYIGIIESDDWIEPDMYEKLYAKAVQQKADIVKCSFWRYNSTRPAGKQDAEELAHYRLLAAAPQEAFCMDEYPELLMGHPSIWASLYRADFIKGQKVIESSSASYQDFPFMVEALCRAERIAVVPHYLVHYRMEEGQGSSTTVTGKRLLMMPTQCSKSQEILRRYGKHDALAEPFYVHAFKACLGFYHQIDTPYKTDFFERMQAMLSGIKSVPGFSYKHFSSRDKRICKLILGARFLCQQRVQAILKAKDIRKGLFSLRVGQKGFCLQLLGLMIATPHYQNRPALWKIRLK